MLFLPLRPVIMTSTNAAPNKCPIKGSKGTKKGDGRYHLKAWRLASRMQKATVSGIQVKIFKQLMIDGTAFNRNSEMEERIKSDFPVMAKITSGMLAEILTGLIHLCP